jgi:two-component system chemotaxis sensor kinase CheA
MSKRSTPRTKDARRVTPVQPPATAADSLLMPEETLAAPVEEPASAPAVPAHDEEMVAYLADPELSAMFVTDAVDHLGTIEAVLLKLEAAPGDSKLLNDLFRPFHTVKGNAGVLGFTSIQDLAHKVETLLDLARSGQHVLGAAEIDVVLRAVDLLLQLTQDLPARAAGQPASDLADRRRSLMDAIDGLIAGSSRPDGPGAPPVAPVPDGPPAESARAEEAAPVPARPGEGHSTVKVSTNKLDSLVDLVGELVIAQSILAEDQVVLRLADDRLNRQLAHVRRIASELQRHTMSMRMVPIRQTFQKMARHVRDLSRRFDKPIDLVLAGEETELDRKVVEHITDPLMHMVRNTVDHGIEPPALRAAAGKPAQARLRLSAFHQAGYIVIEIDDDGAGLDTDKIFKKAAGLGLISEHDALAPAEIHQLIFRPGFSTKDEVTELSGRGVGMDVVRRNVEALRGAVDIRTVAGAGTTFTLRLPLTLATVDGLLLRVGGERFVIPTFAVRESLRPSANQIHTVRGSACLIQIRERLIPILHLGETFGIASARPTGADATIVVLEDGGRPLAVVVDALLGKQEVVIKTLGEMFRDVRGVAGGAILGDGRIGLILDAGGLMSLIDRNALGAVA